MRNFNVHDSEVFQDVQTHVRVINSKDCGAPQSRSRMIVLAAARGENLPEFPECVTGV